MVFAEMVELLAAMGTVLQPVRVLGPLFFFFLRFRLTRDRSVRVGFQ